MVDFARRRDRGWAKGEERWAMGEKEKWASGKGREGSGLIGKEKRKSIFLL